MADASHKELEAILEEFSTSIRASLFKYRLASRGIDPDDVLQEIRIKIWKCVQSEKKSARCSSYISRIVNSTLIDFVRKARQAETLAYNEHILLKKQAGGPEAEADGSSLRLIVNEAADSLVESRRKVIKLFLADLTLEEIARSLNWSRDKTRNLLYRGLSDLKQKLREKGVDYADR